jgi:hypothetical protein
MISLLIPFALLSGLVIESQARIVMCPDDTQVYPAGFSKGPCYQSYYKAMVVFGDSWTENG